MSEEYLPVDTDGDGIEDGAYLDLNNDGVADALAVDTDGDGMADAAYVDTNQDAVVDAVIVDTDGDGVPDTPLADGSAGYASDGEYASEPGYASDGEPESDGGQSFTPPEEVSEADVQQASEDYTAQSNINSGMNATYNAMNAQYGMDLS